MQIYNFSIFILGLIIYAIFLYKAHHNLSEEGEKLEDKRWIDLSRDPSKYYSALGLKYRRIAWAVGFPIAIIGYLIGVVISSSNNG